MTTVSINGSESVVPSLKLRDWLYLEETVQQLHKLVDTRDDNTVSVLLSLVSKFYGIDCVSLPWHEVAEAYSALVIENQLPSYFPMFSQSIAKKIQAQLYPNRSWYVWANAFSKAYGWTLDYIAQLDVVEAIGLFHELLITEQDNREWQWMCSENSVGYDQTTKKSKHVELPRPDWMKPVYQHQVEPPKLVRMKRTMIPVGNVVNGKNAK